METTLRHFGNSIGLVVPKALRSALHFTAGQRVTLERSEQGMLVKPTTHKNYTLEELVARCDPKAMMPEDIKQWHDAPAKGKEIW